MADNPTSSRSSRALIEISPDLLAWVREPRRLLVALLTVAGIVAEVLGYWHISGTVDPGEQMPYLISGGIGGVCLLAAAGALLVTGEIHALRPDVEETSRTVGELVRQVAELRQELDRVTAAPPSAPQRRTQPSEPRRRGRTGTA